MGSSTLRWRGMLLNWHVVAGMELGRDLFRRFIAVPDARCTITQRSNLEHKHLTSITSACNITVRLWSLAYKRFRSGPVVLKPPCGNRYGKGVELGGKSSRTQLMPRLKIISHGLSQCIGRTVKGIDAASRLEVLLWLVCFGLRIIRQPVASSLVSSTQEVIANFLREVFLQRCIV